MGVGGERGGAGGSRCSGESSVARLHVLVTRCRRRRRRRRWWWWWWWVVGGGWCGGVGRWLTGWLDG